MLDALSPNEEGMPNESMPIDRSIRLTHAALMTHDLKKAVDEAELVDPEKKVEVKKGLKKIFYDRYMNQKEVTSEKKAQGSSYFFQKLRF